MRPSALLLAVVIVALSAAPSRAQVGVERPTAIEVAAGVTACMQERVSRVLSVNGVTNKATIEVAGAPAWFIWRAKASERMPGPAQHSMDGDPLEPPMLISTPLLTTSLPSAPWVEQPPLPPQVIACFDQEYLRLLGDRPPA